MPKTIAVFAGSASSFNVIRLIKNVGNSLSQILNPHLITTRQSVAEEATDAYTGVYGTSESNTVLGEINSLRTYLQTSEPAAVFQITSPPIHGTIGGTLSQKYNVPFVYRYSGDRFYEYKVSEGLKKPLHFGLNNVLGRIPLNLADMYVALGPTGAYRLQTRGVDPDQITIVPPIVDQERFSVSGPVAELDTDRDVVLFVGRLSRRKGKQALERTIPTILDRRPNLEFVFLGRQLSTLSLPPEYYDRVTIVGSVEPSAVPHYYRKSSVLVHPSLTEGVPRAVLEALATETPPIARDIGDVAYATENTFTTDSEFIEMVCDFESLNVSSFDKFSFESVSADYHRLFAEIKTG